MLLPDIIIIMVRQVGVTHPSAVADLLITSLVIGIDKVASCGLT